jgi:hypothetical protein
VLTKKVAGEVVAAPQFTLNSNQEPQNLNLDQPPTVNSFIPKQWEWEPHDYVLEELEAMSRRHSLAVRHEEPMRKRELFGVHLRAKKKYVKTAQKRAARPLYGDSYHHHGTLKPDLLQHAPPADTPFRKPHPPERVEPGILPDALGPEIIQINTM